MSSIYKMWTAGHGVTVILCVLTISWLLLSESTLADSISDYRTPKDCQAFYTKDYSGVSLDCKVPAIQDLNFSVVPSKFTQEILLTCDSPYIESSLENFTLSHLDELRQLIFEGCHFSALTSRFEILDVRNGLRSLEIRCNNNAHQILRIEKSSISQLTKLQQMSLTECNINAIPELEFCTLSELKLLVLSSNNITSVQDLGFSNCTATTSHLMCNVSSLKVLDLSYNRIRELLQNDLCVAKNLQAIIFQGNLIEYIHDETFSGLESSLLVLDLSGNKLLSLPRLHHRYVLKFLNVSHNRIKYLDPLNSTTLLTVDVSFNMIKAINIYSFAGLVRLQSLNISHNEISFIAVDAFADLSDLTELDLSHNHLSAITSADFHGMNNIQRLILSNNNISHMESTVIMDCCPHLSECDLSNNHLSTFTNLSGLTELKVINMGRNQLTKIAEDTFSGALQLQGINLKENRITEVHPRAFYNHSQLTLLILAFNNITEIHPTTFSQNLNLAYLDLSKNRLKLLPVLDGNTQLVSLNVSLNQFTYMDYGVLPSSIQTLDASYNQMRSVETQLSTAKKLTVLLLLDLSYNKLTLIKETSLPPMSAYIDLSYNQISTVNSGSFHQMKNLQLVNLRANRIKEVSKGFIRVDTSKSAKAPQFILSSNPLVCSCGMQWILLSQQLDQNYGQINDLSYLYCWVPKIGNQSHSLKLIKDVTPDEFICEFKSHEFFSNFCIDEPKGFCNVTCPGACKCYRNYFWSNIVVYCSSVELKSIPTDISVRTTIVYLDGNSLLNLDNTSFDTDQSRLTILYLNSSQIISIGSETFNAMANLNTLYLQSNGLKSLTKSAFSGLVSLEKLYLYNNSLETLAESVFQPLAKLRVLQLQNNHLLDLPVWMFNQIHDLKSLSIGENPWQCDCGQLDQYREWLQNHPYRVAHKEQLTCNLNDIRVKNSSVLMLYYNASECLNVTSEVKYANHVTAIVSISGAFLFISLITILLFVYRYELQVIIYSHYGLRLLHNNVEVDDDKKIFDAFISYSNLDEEFVANKLVRNLEGIKDPYKLCLHERNFAVGAEITRSIMEAVKYSRRTILVLSENFVRSQWCCFEFKTAHLQMLNDHCNRLILIVHGDLPKKMDPEIKLYLRTNTYLKWDDKLFLKKLYFALPTKKPKPSLMS